MDLSVLTTTGTGTVPGMRGMAKAGLATSGKSAGPPVTVSKQRTRKAERLHLRRRMMGTASGIPHRKRT